MTKEPIPGLTVDHIDNVQAAMEALRQRGLTPVEAFDTLMTAIIITLPALFSTSKVYGDKVREYKKLAMEEMSIRLDAMIDMYEEKYAPKTDKDNKEPPLPFEEDA